VKKEMARKEGRYRTIELAEKYVQAGKLLEAIAEYRKVLVGDIQDINIRNLIGDLYVRLNKKDKAKEEYEKIATYYEDRGLYPQAIAIYKKINKLDPDDFDSAVKMADLYGTYGFLSEAKKEYLRIAKNLEKKGQTKDMIPVYDRLVKLDKGDLETRSFLAELYEKEGSVDQAVEEFNYIAEFYLRNDKMKDAEKILNKAKEAKKNDLRTITNLIELLKKKNKKKDAFSLLYEVLKKDNENIKFLNLLGALYFEDQDLSKAKEIFTKILTLREMDVEARVKLGRVHVQEGNLDEAYDLYEPLVSSLIKRGKGDRATGLLGLILSSKKVHLPSLEKLAFIYESNNEKNKLGTVYKVILEEYRERNQKNKMLSVLEKFNKIFPEDEEFTKEYNLLQSETGMMEEVIEEKEERAEEEVKEEVEEIVEEKEEAEEIVEVKEEEVEEKAEEIVEEEEKVEERVEEIIPEERVEEIIEKKEEAEEVAEEEEVEEVVNEEEVEEPEERVEEIAEEVVGEPEERAEEIAEEVVEEAVEVEERVKEIEEEVVEEVVEEEVEEVEEEKEEKVPEIEREEVRVEGEEREEAFGVSSEDLEILKMKLAKADLYLEQGLIRNARRILEDLKSRYADEPKIDERITMLDEIRTKVEADDIPKRIEEVLAKEVVIETKVSRMEKEKEGIPTTIEPETKKEEEKIEEAEKREGVEVDIASSPAQEAPAQNYYKLNDVVKDELAIIGTIVHHQVKGDTKTYEKELSEIVSEFKKEVDKRVDKEDYEIHYNLGIAFMEQGLDEEAIEAFKLASKDERRAMDCYSVIGNCYKQKEDYKEGIKWIEKGLALAEEGSTPFYALKYDLASFYEIMDESKKALKIYSEIKEWNADYRDISKKIKGLKKSAS
jgi:tetratricopeptide (TPR) repeat protein